MSPAAENVETPSITEDSVDDEVVNWQRAIDRDDVIAIRRLMLDADIFQTNDKGKNALMSAARVGDLELLQTLRDLGLKLADRSSTGGTALMYAALGNQLSMVRYIRDEVNESAYINAQSTNGWTALMIASAKGFDATVRLLVELGADPSLADAYQWSPLMRAIDNRHLGVVEYLTSLDATNVNAINENGSTALHLAALFNDTESAILLMKRPGLDRSIADKQGRTALQIAMESGNAEVMGLIQKSR